MHELDLLFADMSRFFRICAALPLEARTAGRSWKTTLATLGALLCLLSAARGREVSPTLDNWEATAQ
jgi:hypothetical protein